MMDRLFVPGPVDVEKDVMKQMQNPMIYHRGKDFSQLLENCVEKLKKIMYTENYVFISTSSSTGLMEAAIRNCVKKKCLNVATGAFGERWHQIALANGKDADILKIEWGKAATPDIIDDTLSKGNYDCVTLVHNETSTGVSNPIYDISKVIKRHDVCFLVDTVSSMGGIKIEVDELGIDVCLFGSQKALGLPPGLSACSVSEKALTIAETVNNRGYYFDFIVFKKYWLKKQTPSTPALPQIYALNYKLDKILKEGPEKRYQRHRELAEFTRAWTKENFALFPEEKYASNTLTCIKNSRKIDIEKLKAELKKRSFLISNGYGKLKEKTFRIAHMGDRTILELKELLDGIDEILVEL
ncbi:pyridoxal-phosphate-dependent aminotransferase family protein [[Eubacterium] cellulosolvens]